MNFTSENAKEARRLLEQMQGLIKQMGALSDHEMRQNLTAILALEQRHHQIAVRLQELSSDG